MKRVVLCAALLVITACSQRAPVVPITPGEESFNVHGVAPAGSPIQHVVIMVQENRSVDNLFNGLPGADTVKSGLDSHGNTIQLQPGNLVNTYDPDHSHASWVTEYRNGHMNGFNLEKIDNGSGEPADFAYSYVPKSQVKPYWTLAETYAFADRMFATNEGSSYPAHLYLAAGNSAIDDTNTLYVMDNATKKDSVHPGGCDSLPGTTAPLIDPATGSENYTPVFPCFTHQTIFNLLDSAGVTWKWYEARMGRGLWYAPDSYKNIRYSPDYANVSAPNTNIFNDIKNGQLAGVSWVMPTAAESDHAHSNTGTGPAWVAQVVNAIGASPYWNSTAIIVTWDEWGGWYDHVPPVQYNHYELGFRVPLIVVSPYAKQGYVSPVQHEFGSTLKFLEETYNLGSLGTTDVRSDDLSDMFNYAQKPRIFQPIPAPAVPRSAEIDTRIPDDDGDGN